MKGQAFDTCKLLIAAVVAIAILGILLQILNLIKPPGADPETIIQQQLQKAYGHIGSVTVSDGKAKTNPSFFCGEERVEEFIHIFTRDTNPRVMNGELYPSIILWDMPLQYQVASLWHRLNSI